MEFSLSLSLSLQNCMKPTSSLEHGMVHIRYNRVVQYISVAEDGVELRG